MSTREAEDTRGLTQRELILEVRNDVKAHIEKHDCIHDEIERDIRVRPTRSEIFSLLGAAGVLSGLVFGIIQAT